MGFENNSQKGKLEVSGSSNAQPQAEQPSWEIGAKRGGKYGAILATIVLLWIASGYVGVLQAELFVTGCLVVQTILFLLAIPLSLIIRADVLSEYLPIAQLSGQLVATLVVTIMNFVMLGAIISYIRRRKDK